MKNEGKKGYVNITEKYMFGEHSLNNLLLCLTNLKNAQNPSLKIALISCFDGTCLVDISALHWSLRNTLLIFFSCSLHLVWSTYI